MIGRQGRFLLGIILSLAILPVGFVSAGTLQVSADLYGVSSDGAVEGMASGYDGPGTLTEVRFRWTYTVVFDDSNACDNECGATAQLNAASLLFPNLATDTSTSGRLRFNGSNLYKGDDVNDIFHTPWIPIRISLFSCDTAGGSCLPDESGFSATAFGTGPTSFGVGGANGIGSVTVDYTYETVPLPAAVWFFGSGLLGLIAVKRRKRD